MTARILGLAAAVIFSTTAQPAVSDELCTRLRTFETAQLTSSERRWVEFHWGFDENSLWSWGCRHSDDQPAKATCDWLMHHTNQEFSMLLPHDVMACHGYRFPRFAFYDWSKIAGAITLRGRSNRRVVMDLDYRDLPAGENAIRISVEDAGRNYDPDDLPAIRPMTANDASTAGR